LDNDECPSSGTETVLCTSFARQPQHLLTPPTHPPAALQYYYYTQDIFYINFGAWHRKNDADWSQFVPALEALGKDYQVRGGEGEGERGGGGS